MATCVASQSSVVTASPQEAREANADSQGIEEDRDTVQTDRGAQDIRKTGTRGKVIGIKNVCVHVLKLEKSLKLYREILGFELKAASVLHGKGIEGLLVMELHANDCMVHLSLPSPGANVKPVGNTNHNHFMLLVDDIVPICDSLKKEGYALENENYARDKYSFFTGPNGEIIGLTEHK